MWTEASAKFESSARGGARARLTLRARLALASVRLFCRLIRSGRYKNEILNTYEVGERVRDEKSRIRRNPRDSWWFDDFDDDDDDDDLFYLTQLSFTSQTPLLLLQTPLPPLPRLSLNFLSENHTFATNFFPCCLSTYAVDILQYIGCRTSLAHRATNLPFLLAQEQNLLAPGNLT